jgi:hypothetical protein
MTQNGINFNYTLPDSSQIGRVSYGTIGDKDGADPPFYEELCIDITVSGQPYETKDSISSFLLIFGVMTILGLCLWAAIRLPFKNQRGAMGDIIKVNYLKYWKVLFITLSYMVMTWFFNLLHVASVNLTTLSQFTNYFALVFKIMSILAWPIFIIVFVGTLFILWKDLQLEKLLSRGIDER